MAILRDQAPITPSRDDVIDGGDELFFVTTIAAEDGLRALLSAPERADPARQAASVSCAHRQPSPRTTASTADPQVTAQQMSLLSRSKRHLLRAQLGSAGSSAGTGAGRVSSQATQTPRM